LAFSKTLIKDLESSIPCSFDYINVHVDLKLFYSEERHQYYSTLILSEVLKQSPVDADKIIGITNVDIYIPILTFLFGEAQLGGQGALVSTFRLNNEFYGLPRDERVVYQRTLKEVLHELGHTFGLTHCRNYQCVMHSSTYVEDVDLKGAHFCKECQFHLYRNER